MILSNTKLLQAHDLLSKLQVLCFRTEQGIDDCERVCECFMQDDHQDLVTEVSPLEAKLVQILTKIISIENTMLNCMEEMQAYAESKFQLFVPSTSTSPHMISQTPYKKGNIPQLWTPNGYQGVELHKFLQVNEHIDRFCECSEYLTALRDLLVIDTDKEDEFYAMNSADEEDDKVLFLRRRRREHTAEKVGSQFETLVQHFEKAVLCLNKILLQMV